MHLNANQTGLDKIIIYKQKINAEGRGEKNEENRLFSLLILDIGQFDFYLSFKKKLPLLLPTRK